MFLSQNEKIFQKIAQKTMDRENKVKLMYSTPQNYYQQNAKVKSEESELFDLKNQAKSNLRKLNDEIQFEKNKRRAVETELKKIIDETNMNKQSVKQVKMQSVFD